MFSASVRLFDWMDGERDLTLAGLAAATDAVALAADREGALRLYEALHRYDGAQVSVPGAGVRGGSVAYYLGVLGRVAGMPAAAVFHLERALVEHLARGEAAWEARVRCEYARLLLSRGDAYSRHQAAAHLDSVAHWARGRDGPLADEAAGLRQRAADVDSRESGHSVIEWTDGVWKVRFRDATFHVPNVQGMGWLARLLAQPWRDLEVERLASIPVPEGDRAAVERARVRVTRGVRDAIDRISARHAALGAHLAQAVHTGRTCAYRPQPDAAETWVIEGSPPSGFYPVDQRTGSAGA